MLVAMLAGHRRKDHSGPEVIVGSCRELEACKQVLKHAYRSLNRNGCLGMFACCRPALEAISLGFHVPEHCGISSM